MKNSKILVLNAGSSSIKWALYGRNEDGLLHRGRIERLGTSGAKMHVERFYGSVSGIGEEIDEEHVAFKDDAHAIRFILNLLLAEKHLLSFEELAAVGHRVVHGGEVYQDAALVTPDVLEDLKGLIRLAPLHQPHNIVAIERIMALLPGLPNVAVFDTAFHQTMGPAAYQYALDPKLTKFHGIRKYGFHGINHQYVAGEAARILGGMPRRMVTCHLGNGSSITALREGRSVDTSMGFTPTDGLVMGTRTGSIDPEAVLYLQEHLKKRPGEMAAMLNNDAGLKALCGTQDMRDIWQDVKNGKEEAKLAFDMLTYQAAKLIGSYAAALNGLDCLVFTGGMGEQAWYVRSEICSRLSHLGLFIETDKNQAHGTDISGPKSAVKVLVISANEELQIARETRDLL